MKKSLNRNFVFGEKNSGFYLILFWRGGSATFFTRIIVWILWGMKLLLCTASPWTCNTSRVSDPPWRKWLRRPGRKHTRNPYSSDCFQNWWRRLRLWVENSFAENSDKQDPAHFWRNWRAHHEFRHHFLSHEPGASNPRNFVLWRCQTCNMTLALVFHMSKLIPETKLAMTTILFSHKMCDHEKRFNGITFTLPVPPAERTFLTW